jgi:uncharacterized protein YbjT (DUF2867 family)
MIHFDISKLQDHKIAIFGSTGYIGMILAETLRNTPIQTKLFVRNKRRIRYLFKQAKNLSVSDIELIPDNVDALTGALEGYDTIIYLIHSMTKGSTTSFVKQDQMIASVVGEAAIKADIQNIIYVSGLGMMRDGKELSPHLASRQQTAHALHAFGVPVTELRAGVIIGAGSASFEIIRNLGTKLPIMPQLSIETGLCQPIDIDAVISYIFESVYNKNFYGEIIEIGGDEVYTYSQMVKLFADEVKQRSMPYIKLPWIERLITKELISWVTSRLTSLPIQLTKPLIGGIDSLAIVGDYPVSRVVPECRIKPMSYLEAIKQATDRESRGETISLWGLPIETQVYDKKESAHFKFSYNAQEVDGLLYEERVVPLREDEIEPVFKEIKRIGGKNGYWSPYWIWKTRGVIDSLFGGPGLSGRIRNYSELREGERFDFWTVSRFIERDNLKKVRLKARMLTPGQAWLEFTITKQEEQPVLVLRAYFDPSGIWGYFYWYSLYFIHKYMFSTMINNLYKKATSVEPN